MMQYLLAEWANSYQLHLGLAALASKLRPALHLGGLFVTPRHDGYFTNRPIDCMAVATRGHIYIAIFRIAKR